MPITSNRNDFIPGVDISALSTLSKSDLIQMIAGAIPVGDGSSSGIGGVIVLNSQTPYDPNVAPTVYPDVANNPRFARYLWIDTYELRSGGTGKITLRYWSGTYDVNGTPSALAADWKNAVVQSAVTTDDIEDAAITASKITGDSASDAGKLLALNAAGDAGTWVNFADLFNNTGITVPISRVTPPSSATTNSLLSWTGATWAAIGAQAVIDALSSGAIPLNKLQSAGATDGQQLVWDATNTTWKPASTPFTKGPFIATASNSLASVTSLTGDHGLDTMPSLVRAVCVLSTAFGGYPANCEIPVECFSAPITPLGGSDEDFFVRPAFAVYATASSVGVYLRKGSHGLSGYSGDLALTAPSTATTDGTSALTVITNAELANFTLKIYAWA